MTGCMYAVGVGPGDPEMMTIRAAKRLAGCGVIAIPGSSKEACTAYQIAVRAVPAISEKECLCLPLPMTRDREELARSHKAAAGQVIECLRQGTEVCFITLGDVTIYSTGLYLMKSVTEAGYPAVLECGIPSFCAASARLGLPLVMGEEELHVIPGTSRIEEALKLPGVKVFMKAGREIGRLKARICECGCDAVMVEKCGMPGERVYTGLEEIPENPSYYSLLIVR